MTAGVDMQMSWVETCRYLTMYTMSAFRANTGGCSISAILWVWFVLSTDTTVYPEAIGAAALSHEEVPCGTTPRPICRLVSKVGPGVVGVWHTHTHTHTHMHTHMHTHTCTHTCTYTLTHKRTLRKHAHMHMHIQAQYTGSYCTLSFHCRYTPQDLQCLPLKTVTSLSVSVPQQQVHTSSVLHTLWVILHLFCTHFGSYFICSAHTLGHTSSVLHTLWIILHLFCTHFGSYFICSAHTLGHTPCTSFVLHTFLVTLHLLHLFCTQIAVWLL